MADEKKGMYKLRRGCAYTQNTEMTDMSRKVTTVSLVGYYTLPPCDQGRKEDALGSGTP